MNGPASHFSKDNHLNNWAGKTEPGATVIHCLSSLSTAKKPGNDARPLFSVISGKLENPVKHVP